MAAQARHGVHVCRVAAGPDRAEFLGRHAVRALAELYQLERFSLRAAHRLGHMLVDVELEGGAVIEVVAVASDVGHLGIVGEAVRTGAVAGRALAGQVFGKVVEHQLAPAVAHRRIGPDVEDVAADSGQASAIGIVIADMGGAVLVVGELGVAPDEAEDLQHSRSPTGNRIRVRDCGSA